jgi:hypothetical protein
MNYFFQNTSKMSQYHYVGFWLKIREKKLLLTNEKERFYTFLVFGNTLPHFLF